MRVSVIIPVYNAGQYLKMCLESVCSQTLRGIEVICIDDGSTDDSYAILKQYGESDRRIRIFRQSNSGPGPARNRGLLEAAGEFVAFLDADDFYMDADALEQMYKACIANDVKVCGSALKYLRQGIITDDMTLKEVKEAAKKDKILEYQDFQFDYGYTGFLFSRRLLIERKIDFPAYRRYQDPCFLVRAMYTAKKFVFSDAALYVCRVPTMASRFSKDKAMDLLMGIFDNLSFACEKNYDKLFQASLMRLEYEYYSIICHFVTSADKEMLDLLWKINRFVCRALNDNEYMIRPLQFIISEDENFYQHYEKNLCEKISALPYIYVYGAGGMAGRFIAYLKKENLSHKIKGIIVSECKEDNKFLEGIPVKGLNQLELKADEYIFIAVGAVFHKEIENSLKRNGFYNHIILDSTFLEELPESEGCQ